MAQTEISNDPIADKAKADKAAREQLLQSYGGRICPVLSVAGGLRPGGASLVGATGGPIGGAIEGEAVACQGPNCMKFVITASDQDGRALRGGCADALLPAAILQLRDANLAIAQDFIGKYKIRPI